MATNGGQWRGNSFDWLWFQFDTGDLSIAVVRERYPDGKPKTLRTLFSLRCGFCGRWFGCSEHWFCEVCDTCREAICGGDDDE